MTPSTQDVDGVLLLYHHPPVESAPATVDHIQAFGRHSEFPVFSVNTDCGFPSALDRYRFRAIVLHYTLFGGWHYFLSRRYLDYLDRSRESHKIAFFQDEYRYCAKRFQFLTDNGVDVVYSLLEPEYHDQVYEAYTKIRSTKRTLTGYVSDNLLAQCRLLSIPDVQRTVDIGYRARQLDYWMGQGGQEKHEIAEQFVERARGMNLELDITAREVDRIYGPSWYEFVANCRGMLGVEAGVSVFDIDDSARERTEQLLAAEPYLDFEEVHRRIVHEYEGGIPYRTVSPRHLEAAAFRVVQILHPGEYSGVLVPDVHYLALEKDFSNFDDVMARFRDPKVRRETTGRAYKDLIVSGRFSYRAFIREFDVYLASVGVAHTLGAAERLRIDRALQRGRAVGRLAAQPMWFTKILVRSLVSADRPGVFAAYQAVRRALEAP